MTAHRCLGGLQKLDPRGEPGVKSRMCPSCAQRIVKGDQMGRFLGITVLKGWPHVGS